MAPRKPLPNDSRARIIFDLDRPEKDKFVNRRFAEELAALKQLKPLEHPELPHSYLAP